MSAVLSRRVSVDDRLMLRAGLAKGRRGAEAFARWRSPRDLSDVPLSTLRFLPLVAENQSGPDGTSGDPMVIKLWKIARFSWVRSRYSTGRATMAMTVLAEAQVEFMVLKGMAVLELADQPLFLRPMDDLDIAVHPADAAAAFAALSAEGFTPKPYILESPMWQQRGLAWFLRYRHSIDLVEPGGAAIDLHWHPIYAARTQAVAEHLWAGSVPGSLGGIPCRFTCAEDTLVHSIVHAVGDPNAGLRWAADTTTLVRSKGDALRWDRVVETARLCQISLEVADALRFLEAEIDIAVPTAALAALESLTWRERGRAWSSALERWLKEDHPRLISPVDHAVRALRVWRTTSGETPPASPVTSRGSADR